MGVSMRTCLILLAAGLSGCLADMGQGPATSRDLQAQAADRGRVLAVNTCASCHAVGREGASPLAAAPPFRDIVRRRSLADLEAAFVDGGITGHPAMPRYVFRASEIDDLIAYLRSLEDAG